MQHLTTAVDIILGDLQGILTSFVSRVMDLTSTLVVVSIWGVIFVIHEINGCNGQDLIGSILATEAVLRGDSRTLTCSRKTGSTSPVGWFDAVPGENNVPISIGTDITTSLPKYTNFLIESSNEDEFNLAISGIAVEDEGFYLCQLYSTGEQSLTVTLTVEVQSSSMSMTQDGNPVDSSNKVIVTVGETSAIVCTALAARPMVDILWFHLKSGVPDNNKVEITTGMTQTNTSYPDGTSDTVSTLQYTPGNNEYDDGTIRCESTGQLVATPVNAAATLSVQYMPNVIVQYGGDRAICSSVANPDVPLKGYADMQGYIFIVNNTDEYAPTECSDGQCTLNLEVKFNTDVRCNATNSIGTGFDTTLAAPGAVITTTPEPTTPGRGTTISGVICNDTIYVAFLVILSLLLVALLVFNIVVVIRYKRLLKSGKMSNSQTQMESRTPNPTNLTAGGDQYQELNTKSREKEHAYQQPDSSGLPQRVENEQGPTYEDLNTSSNDNQPTYEVAGDEVKAGGNQQSPMYVNARPTRPRHGKHDK